jgi:nucleoside-diphosphate-sugar epimerase
LGAAVLAAWLKAPDAEVVVAGRAAPPVAAGVRPAGPARPVHPVHFVRWDVRQDAPAELAEAARGAAALVHLAAGPGVWFAAREPLQDLDVGVGGALRALALAARAQVGAVVFASTVLVYADPWDADEHAAVEPASVYAAGKLAAEHYLRVLAPGAGVRVAVLRLSWCYGAAMRRGPVADVLRWVRAPDEPLRLYHDLDSEYDLLAAEDAAAAILAAARTPGWPSGPVNVGAGEAVRLGDVVGAAQGVVGRAPTLQIEARAKVRARILAPIAAAHGWKPAVTWREGLGALFRGARNT